jgi:hypothetical protein
MLNNVVFQGTVSKVYKSGFTVEIPPRGESTFTTNVWVKLKKDATGPSEGTPVLISGSLSSSPGKNGAPPQLCVFAFDVIPIIATAEGRKPPEDDIPF